MYSQFNPHTPAARASAQRPFPLQAASDSHTDVGASAAAASDDDEEEEEIVPGKMKVRTFGVDFSRLDGTVYKFYRSSLNSHALTIG